MADHDQERGKQPFEDPAQPPVLRKFCGLDPINRTFLKLFIRDVIFMKPCTFQDVDASGFCFRGHVVEKVDILGTVVKVDIKEIKHSYVVDDGTGVILCNSWKNQKQSIMQTLNNLPQSLLNKQSEITSSYVPQNEGLSLGDLVCFRGSVRLYAGQKEIDILSMTKFDNPNYELERVLELPGLYDKCYNKPSHLPDRISQLSSISNPFSNIETLKYSISKHLEENLLTLDAFSMEDFFLWPLFEDNLKGEICNAPQVSLIDSALKSISETQGSICKQFDSTDRYEVIKEGCSLCKEVLRIFQKLNQETKNHTAGIHVNSVHSLLAKSHRYASIANAVLQKAVQCLENTSDIISIDFHRYMPL